MANDSSTDIEATFAEITHRVASAEDVDSALARLSRLAVLTVDACEHAGVTVRREGDLLTTGATAAIVEQVDHVQYDLREGPCVQALDEGPEVYAADLAGDERWPRFGPRAAELGVLSMLSLQLFSPDQPAAPLGALNLYASDRDAFADHDRATAVILAAHASVAVAAAESTAKLRRINDELREALQSRDVIGQAKGILMERYRVSATEAFEMLRRSSQHLNVKLRAVAEGLTDTGSFPEP